MFTNKLPNEAEAMNVNINRSLIFNNLFIVDD